MDSIAFRLHQLFNKKARFLFPFDTNEIPKNGIYILFEKGEVFDGMDRVVRIGTHTGKNQLRSRLKQHFIQENKNRSIFRKNIGRCFLNKENKAYLDAWELDLTPKKDREDKLKIINPNLESELEKRISKYIQDNFTFFVFEVNSQDERLFWESKLISTLSNAAKTGEIKPSKSWLGHQSTKNKIRESGLWQVNELYKNSLTENEFERLITLVK